MKREVGVRELRAETSSILRRVRKEHASVDITYYGKVIARIVPVEAQASEARRLMPFGRISTVWPARSDRSGVQTA